MRYFCKIKIIRHYSENTLFIISIGFFVFDDTMLKNQFIGGVTNGTGLEKFHNSTRT